MIRNLLAALYALAVIGLIGSTCWAAGGMKAEQNTPPGASD